jgi:nucleotide-binding universal stress UspA family protein
VEQVVVGVDSSEAARAALHWAVRVANRIEAVGESTGPTVTAIAVWTPGSAELPPQEWRREQSVVRDLLDLRTKEGAQMGVRVGTELREGDPADVLLTAAADRRADMLVVGNRGEGNFAGLRVGSVIDQLSHHTPKPLAIVPAYEQPAPRRIVVGADGSLGTAAAIRWCAQVARELHAEVSAIHLDSQQRDRVPMRDYRAARVREPGASWYDEVARGGHAADGLLEAANRIDATLIVLGTPSIASTRNDHLNGEVTRLLHKTRLPVVLVPAAP